MESLTYTLEVMCDTVTKLTELTLDLNKRVIELEKKLEKCDISFDDGK